MHTRATSTIKGVAGWWAKRTLAQRFAISTAVLIAGGTIVQGAVLIGFASQIVVGLERERISDRLDRTAGRLTSRVSEFSKIPKILAGTPPIKRIAHLSTGGSPRLGESLDEWKQRLGIIFSSILEANPDLTQARLIGVADGGRELVRVNRVGTKLEVVDAAKLQPKGRRPYFEETAKLGAGEVYLSPIEANVENGKVIRPFETTVRAGTPIFTDSGKLFGVIITNADAGRWLSDMSKLADLNATSGRFLVANQTGDYVFRSDGGPLFGSYDGRSRRFEHDWPALEQILRPGTPRVDEQLDNGQFVATRRVRYDPARTGEFLVLITDVEASSVFGSTWSFVLLGGAVAIAMAIIGMIAAFAVSRPLKGLMDAARKIAAGTVDVQSLALSSRGADIGELGEALQIMKDAVERRDASLRKSEMFLKAIVKNSIDGIITVDRNGTILSYNHGCQELFGFAIDEALGRDVSLIIPDDKERTAEGRARRGIARFVGARQEATGRHKNGRKISLEVAISEIEVEGEVIYSGTVRDITERKKVERLKSEFVSTVTHELRTPLTSVMGSLGLLRAGALGKMSQKAERMINLAYDNGGRLVNLINDILDIDKIEAGQLLFKEQEQNLKALITQAVEQNAMYGREQGVTIVTEDFPGEISIVTDADRFQQVMANLLSNAAKFSPKGGKVRVTAKMRDAAVRISVIDQGPGIPVEFQSRVFQKFAQGDSSDTRTKGGTGLGLSIAKAIVERLGGKIGFQTQVGAGTVFFFDLPASQGSASAEGDHTEKGRLVFVNPKPAADETLRRVLHIEDDADTCAVLAESLADVAHVTSVSTAEDAREMLLTKSFDLIVLDMLLPDENGDSVLRFLLERSAPPPPILVFSALEMAVERWPPVSRALVKSRTDIVTLRNHVVELLGEKASPTVLRHSA